MMKKIPPYYPNPDDSHCWQAALRMILEHFNPDKIWTWEELNKLTGKTEGKWTWPMKTYVELPKLGYDVEVIEIWDYKEFVDNPLAYLTKTLGTEEANISIKNSNIEMEVKYSREFLNAQESIIIKNRVSTIADIKRYIDDGYLIIHWVNEKKLKKEKGFIGHFVVVYDYDGENVIFHNPVKAGNLASVKVPQELFYKASLVKDRTGGFYAIRLKQK